MATPLSFFHYHASQLPARFDFEADNFTVDDIYNYYKLKVSLSLNIPASA